MKKTIKKLIINKVADMKEIEIMYHENGDYHPNDFSLFYDVNLESLIDDLEYNGLTSDDIIRMNHSHYGNVIDIYHDGDMYYLFFGVR